MSGVVAKKEGADRAKPKFAPVDLDRVPQVEQLLRELGYGPFDRDQVSAPVGRNQVWAGPTESGTWVFVKRLVGSDDYVSERMERLLAFERVRGRLPGDAFLSPALLGHDVDAGLVVFAHIADARSGAELMVDQEFEVGLAADAGRAIGLLHSVAPDEVGELTSALPYIPSPELLVGVPAAWFDNMTFAEIEAWGMLQRDEPLAAGVKALREREQQAPRVPSHCDMRVDQLLINDDGLHITDWEEFRLADPARDVGAFAGEWLYRSVLDIVTSRGDTRFLDADLTHETVVQRGVENLERLRPRVEHFWSAYLEVRGTVDDGLATRATAFAGWHLLDRLIAGAERQARLSGIERAAAGIGRAALLTPERFVESVGLGGGR